MTRPRALQHWTRHLLDPGLRLMGRLHIGPKIGLVVGAALLPLLALLLWQVRTAVDQHRQARSARAALAVVQAGLPLHSAVLALRAASEAQPEGAPTTPPRADDLRAEALRALTSFEQAVQAAPGLELQAATGTLRQQLQAAADVRRPGLPTDAGAMPARALQTLREATVLAAERGGLADGDDAATRLLVHVVVRGLLPLVDALGAARASGSVLLAQDAHNAPLDARATALALVAQVEILAGHLANDTAMLERVHGIATGSWNGARGTLGEFTAAARRSFAAEQWPVDPRAFAERGSAALVHASALARDLGLRIDQRLLERAAAAERTLIVLAVAGLGMLGLVLYLATCATLGLRGTVKAVRRALESVAQGDLAARVAVRGADELADIGRTVDTMNERLSSMVAEIRNHAERVDAAGTQMSQGSERLATRTEEQAGRVATSAATITQLTAAVAHNAQAARALDELTQRVFVQAEDGQAAMADTLAAMHGVQASTEQVTSIVGVIDEVAFQTGMLAINASVEAARAGDAGKGFAVVAAEVRQLAARCAESAEEIRELLGSSARQVDASSQKLQNASLALDGIVGGVRAVSGELRTIATASTQQSAGLDEVSAGIAALDGITRDNSALVEESHAAARSLVERAAALRASVASMRLRHGSPDEAVALVDRALDHAGQCGRAQALADFHQAEGPWTDRDLYLIAFDRLGNVVACGPDPARLGASINDTPGVAGTAFLDQVWDAAQAGGGWVRYQIVNPTTGRMSAKESWFRQLDDETVIGCGVFLAEQPLADGMSARAVSWSTAAGRQPRLAGA